MKIDKTKQSPNYSVYNGVTKRTVKTAVCMHKTVGSFSGAIEWLCTTPDHANWEETMQHPACLGTLSLLSECRALQSNQ